MRTRLVLGAVGLAVVAGTVAPALASPDPAPTGPCPVGPPQVSVTNVDTRVTVACTTVVIPVALPHPTLVSAPTCLPNAWISGSELYVQVGCKPPIAIPIPITGPPPGA